MSAPTLTRPLPAQSVPPPVREDRAGWWAFGVWAAALPLVFAVPDLNPFRLRYAMAPLELGLVLLAVVAAAWRRRPLVGLAAGLYAAWVALVLRMALAGTPYGFDGLHSDALRLTAMATRFSTTWHSVDGIVGTVPSEYPPLYPWVIGRSAALLGTDAWRLMGPGAVVVLSFGVVAAFLLWRRLVPDLVALAIPVAALTADARPEKAHEVVALLVAVPWLLAAFGEPPRGRLHWLPAGLIGGLLVLTYQGYLMFAVFGVLVLVGLHRRIRHALLTGAVAAVTASWFLVPYLWWGLVHGMEMTDTFQSGLILDSPFPFLAMTPMALLELLGLAGLLWFRGREWWAAPLLLLTVSCYVYRVAAMVGFTLEGETRVFQYTNRMVVALLVAAGVLTLARAVPALRPQPGLGGAAVVLLVAWAAVTQWQAWMPGQPVSSTGRFQRAVSERYTAASRAFAQPLPDGSHQARTPRGPRIPGLPVTLIQHEVRVVRGPEAAPSVLSYSEALFAYLPWHGYLPTAMSCTGGPVHWFSRFRRLRGLSAIADPAEFARRSSPIEVFVLHRESARDWTWRPWDWSAHLTFHPAQFSPARFEVFQLPNSTVLVVRTSAVVPAPPATDQPDDRE